jgi:hypothetical protein
MADPVTPLLGLTKPTVGADRDAWGSITNVNWDLVDACAGTMLPLMDGVAAIGASTTWARANHVHPVDTSRLATTGGTISGSLSVTGTLNVSGDAVTNGRVFAAGGVSPSSYNSWEWTLYSNGGGDKIQQYRANYFDSWASNDGLRQWVSNGVAGMTLDTSGNLTVTGRIESDAGRVISRLNAQPSIAMYSPSAGVSLGFWLGPSNNGILWGNTDGAGAPSSQWGYVTNSQIGFAAATVSLSANESQAILYGNASTFNVPGAAFKPGGGLWTDGSDARIKTVLGDYTSGLDAILALRPVRYRLKGNWHLSAPGAANPPTRDGATTSPHAPAAAAGTEFIGLVAQDTEAVMPEMVSRVAAMIDGAAVNDLRLMDKTALVMALVNAVQTLAARVAVLEAA